MNGEYFGYNLDTQKGDNYEDFVLKSILTTP